MLWTFSEISEEIYELPSSVGQESCFVCTKTSCQNNLGSGGKRSSLSHRLFPGSICIQTTNKHNYQASASFRKLRG